MFSGRTATGGGVTAFVGEGLWGTGMFAIEGSDVDQSYTTYIERCNKANMDLTDCIFYPTWIKVAEAFSILLVLFLLVGVCLGGAGKALPAAGICGFCSILAIVPFALWESKACGVTAEWFQEQFKGVETLKDNSCNRSWSYAFQVTAFVFLLVSVIIFGVAHKKGRDEV